MMPRLRLSKTTLLLVSLLVSACLIFTFSGAPSSLHLDRERPGHFTNGARPASSTKDAQGQRDRDAQQAARDRAQVPIITEGLEYAADGLVRGFGKIHAAIRAAGRPVTDEQHPITELMERGRRRWDSLLKRQSKTLEHAVTEYQKRYNRLPPRGFDKWFQFCKEHGVKIIDDYDQIERDIGPWLGIAPAEFRRRVEQLEKLKHSYKITLRPGHDSTLTGDRAHGARAKEQFRHLESLTAYLSEDITIYASDHDMGNSVISDEFRNAALDAAAKGTYLSEDELKRFENGADKGMGLLAACDPKSPARQLNTTAPREAASIAIARADNSTSFMYDPKPGMSYCQNPALMKYHGAFTWPQRRGAVMRPVFQLSKVAQNNDFVMTPLEAYRNASSKDGLAQTSEWADKTIDKLFWRGSSTGDSYTQAKSARPGYDWRTSHRPRMHLFAQNKVGDAHVWVNRGAAKGWQSERWSHEELNERYLDVGFAGRVHQCDAADGTCDEMAHELVFKPRVDPRDAIKYKYVLDMDGNGWSSRFHRLLASGSVVVKSTIYPEWNSDWLTPWVHYVPAKIDYSDIYDIMSFFAGAPDDALTNHDALARQIAQNARKFTTEHWRWEDMQAYMLRLLLEYARLGAEDREAHSFKPKAK